MELDRHKLAEERRWRLENYRKQVERLVGSLVDAIKTEGRRVLEREITYAEDMREEYTYTAQAGQLQHTILQAINNADFGGLTRDAGDLHAVEMALFTLEKMKGALPPEMRELLEENERAGLQARIDSKLARLAEMDARDANDCRASVHDGGRGPGFHRCSRKGKETVTVDLSNPHVGIVLVTGDSNPKATEIKLCGQHAKDARNRGSISLYVPNEWSRNQSVGFRQKETREIAAMQRQLSGELLPGEAQRQIGPAITIIEED